ncbi:MAG: TolC family protein [Holosporales bacterium]|jgi:outer membrane protein|nr:TolC family protein [Holosporales bacterium]
MYKFWFNSIALSVILTQCALATEDDTSNDVANKQGRSDKSNMDSDDRVNKLVETIATASQEGIIKDKTNGSIEIYKVIMARTIEGSKDLRMLRSEVIKGLGEGRTARGEFLPDLKLTSSLSRGFSESSSVVKDDKGAYIDADTMDSRKVSSSGPGVGFSLSQNIFNGGASLAAVRKASFDSRAAYAKYKATEGEAVEKMFKLAFNVITCRLMIRYREISKTVYKEILKCELEKLNVGEVDRSEVALAEGRVAKCEAELAFLKARLCGYEGDLSRWVGLKAEDLPLSFPDFVRFFPNDVRELINIAERENSKLQAGHFDMLASKAAISRANAGYLPKLDLSIGGEAKGSWDKVRAKKNLDSWHATDQGKDSTTGSRGASVNLTLTVPIDIKGGVAVNTGGARQDYIKIKIDNEKAYSDLKSDIETTYDHVTYHKNAVSAHKRHVKACEIQLQASLQELAVGAKVYTQVLKAQSDVLDAQKDYVQALQTYAETGLHMLLIIGRLNPQTLGVSTLDFNHKKTYDDKAVTADLNFDDVYDEYERCAKESEEEEAAAVVKEAAPVKTVQVKNEVKTQKDASAPVVEGTKIFPAKVEMRPIL